MLKLATFLIAIVLSAGFVIAEENYRDEPMQKPPKARGSKKKEGGVATGDRLLGDKEADTFSKDSGKKMPKSSQGSKFDKPKSKVENKPSPDPGDEK